MVLNETQQQTVRSWVAGGAGLSEVQKRLQSEFNISLTFMDVRLLVLELGAKVQDKPEAKPAKKPAAKEDLGTEESEDAELEGDSAGGAGRVSVSLDRVVQAGALASGTVTFSDGVTANWMLDQMGRLGLTAKGKPKYRPTEEDVRAFQTELQHKLSSRGY
ncbi:MAG: hypothetical protein PHR35_05100 [Kiritimatiellae bacterium]|nr:hypothetical protein [Kiritimatiellia bacterium]